MGLEYGIGVILIGGFFVLASWKDHTFNNKYDDCKIKVQKCRKFKSSKSRNKQPTAK